MIGSFLLDHIYIFVFLVVAFVFACGAFVTSYLIAPRIKTPETRITYECGMDPFSEAWSRFTMIYYIYALMFLAFDVDVLYLFPVAIVYREDFNGREIVELVIFIAILSLAIVYVWKKGIFQWGRKTREEEWL